MDYIFHFAEIHSPYYIQNDPVGMKSNLMGTINVLGDTAGKREQMKVLFASTREVYGDNVRESILGGLPLVGWIAWMITRSCYPESKRHDRDLV